MLNWLLSLFSKLCKKKSCSTAPKNTAESAPPKAESKPADKVVAPVEAAAPPASEKVISTPEPVQTVSQVVETPVVKATPKVTIAVEDSNVPQDSMLRRHYLTNLDAIITAAATPETKTVSEEPQPIAVKEEAPAIIEPVVVKTETVVAVTTPDQASKIPQDSTLRRHYRSHLSAQIQANLPARPTDATLRRHYDAMLESEVNKQLAE